MKFILFSIIGIITILFSFQSESMLLTCVDDNTFLGTTSTDWNTASNWSANCVPGQGVITGTIKISSDCTVSSSNTTSYTFGAGSNLVIDAGVTLTNNGTGTWTIAQLSGTGNYTGNIMMSGTIKPGSELICSGVLHPAFAEFNTGSVTISLDGNEVTIESNGLPDHTSPYWDSTNALYIDPVVADPDQMSPGIIHAGSYTLTVPVDPQMASTTTETGLGAIGIGVSGVPIFNGQEGPNNNLSLPIANGFDYAGGHNGPTGYHYHTESKDVAANTTLSYDDEQLVGVLQDGFFLYGRKCNSTGDHPTDLDDSGGHTSGTQHCTDDFYHYHIINEIYIGSYILLFNVDLQGTPNSIL